MDPDWCLNELRGMADGWESSGYSAEESAAQLASYFQILDQWLSRGGFLPKAWERK